MKRALRLIYQPYKWLIYLPVAGFATMFFAGVAISVSALFGARMGSLMGGVLWARLLAWLLPMPVRVRGREHADPRRSYIVACNHLSHADVLVLYGWLGLDLKWVMKRELRDAPGLGLACAKLGHIYIDRSDHRAAVESIQAARDRILPGTSVIFFPEGTRSRDGELQPFKKGAFRMALDLGLPILPITVRGTREVLPPEGFDLCPGRVEMVMHPPIETTGLDESAVPDLMERTWAAIASALEDRP